MLSAVEKLYSILVRLGSRIINVLATLKCVGLQKIYARWRWSPRSLLPIQIHVKFHSTLGGLQVHARWRGSPVNQYLQYSLCMVFQL